MAETRTRVVTGSAAGLGLAVLLSISACTTTAPITTQSTSTLGFPSPLTGPGVPVLERADRKALDTAWRELSGGQLNQARSRAARVRANAVRDLLLLQTDLSEGEERVGAKLVELAGSNPEYGAAWITLSVAAESEGNEKVALEAALRGAELWRSRGWDERATALHQRWVAERIESSQFELDKARAPEALVLLDRALSLEPHNVAARLLRARALIAVDDVELAEQELVALSGEPEALFLAATIAEGRSDWLTAMDLYQSLPADFPGQETALSHARLRWRLSHLPAYVQSALAAPELTRGQLASLLVALAPEVGSLVEGRAPVLSDIVDVPAHREILIAVRLGLLEIDPLEHRFYPDGKARIPEAHSAVEALCHLLDKRPPIWCTEDAVTNSSCTPLADPVQGGEVAGVILGVVQGESQ